MSARVDFEDISKWIYDALTAALRDEEIVSGFARALRPHLQFPKSTPSKRGRPSLNDDDGDDEDGGMQGIFVAAKQQVAEFMESTTVR
jgi:hypothetical protein